MANNRFHHAEDNNQDEPLLNMGVDVEESSDEENVAPAAPAADIDSKNQQIISNAKKHLSRYSKLVKYYESQIIIASEQLNRTEEAKIREASKQLKVQLEIYSKHLNDQREKQSIFHNLKEKFDKSNYPFIHKLNTDLDNLYHRSENADLTTVDNSLTILNNILARPERKDLCIRKFSHESEIVKKADIEAKLNEYKTKGIIDPNNLPGGKLNADPVTSIKDFSDEARVNRINFEFSQDGNPVSVNLVSVQQTENGRYSSSLYMSHSIDGLPRQWHFGYTLPNDIYLKIAIAEVQNWRAGHPDLRGKNRIHIVGNMSADLVEAFILYCEHKGYPYSNDTIHPIKLSSFQLSGYSSQLKTEENNGKYLVRNHKDNNAALANGKEIKECEIKTKLDDQAINKIVKESEEKTETEIEAKQKMIRI